MELVIMILFGNLVLGQVIYTIIPQIDNGPSYLFADEGTLNVSVFWEVYSQSNQLQKRWIIQRQSDGTVLEIMFTNGDVT